MKVKNYMLAVICGATNDGHEQDAIEYAMLAGCFQPSSDGLEVDIKRCRDQLPKFVQAYNAVEAFNEYTREINHLPGPPVKRQPAFPFSHLAVCE